ncbi:MAG: carboxypeptidase regulatory-like domain-containing protein [Vicinamibacterales bacterium]
MGRYLIRAVLLVLFAASSVTAQTTSATTASVTGIVTDSSSGALPGVTVNISGPSMMGAQSAITGGDGVYRLVAIPPGEYTVTYELPGFATVKRENVRLTANFTATINIALGIAALEENVIVTGASPVVDVQATAIATTFDKETLANLPSARDYWAILSEAPGVKLQRIDVGGSAAGTQTTYFVFGTTGQNRPMVEGINSTEGTGAFGNYVDYGSFEEVVIGSGASSAESPVPGVFTQLISKSGGNTYHGSFYGDYESKDWQAYNIDDAQVAAGVRGGGGLDARDVNRLNSYRDLNGDVGGYLKKDKLWWYASARALDSSVRYVNFPVKPHATHLRNFTAKATYMLSQNNKFIGYYQPSSKVQNNRLDRQLLSATVAIHNTEDASFRQDYHPLLWKAEFDRVMSPSTYFEVRTGQFGYEWPDTPNGTGPSYEDLGNNIVSGKARSRQLNIQRTQILGSISRYKSGWVGSHNFKAGWEWFRETSTPQEKAGTYNDVLHVLRNGAPIEVLLFQTPTKSENGLYTMGLYLTDTWRMSNRLTANLGLRFDHYRNFLPAQELPLGQFTPVGISFDAVNNLNTWNLPAPRVGISYALTEDNRTILKANAGRYWWNPGAQLSQDVNPNSSVWFKRYVWSDANGDLLWQPGEEGRLTAQQGGVASQRLAPDLKNSYTNELATWIERELSAGFGVRSGFVWRGERNLSTRFNANQPFSAFNVPVQITDPGPDGVVGNADDGGQLTAYNLDPAYLGLPVVNVYDNVDGAKNDFYTWELTGTKRMSKGFSLLASFTKTWSAAQNGCGSSGCGTAGATFFGTAFRQNALPVTPNDLINTEPDGKMKFTDWNLKLHGTIEAPLGFRISPMLRHQAGQNFGRTFLATMNYGSVRIAAEPLDARRQRNINVVDVRVERTVSLGSLTLGPFMDVYNIFNANPEQNLTWSSGSSFLRPTAIVPPRVLRIGAKLNW